MSIQSRQEASALELKNVVKTFGDKTALSDVSLRVGQHEVVGLIGENGAGKSTLLKVIGGLHQQDSGTLTIHGQEHRLRSSGDAASLGIGVVHQEQSLVTNLTVTDNLAIGGLTQGASAWARLGLYRWRQLHAETTKVLARIGITIDPRTRIDQLSFAQRQMIEIARAVATGERAGTTPIVVLDEPTSVLEPHEIDVLAKEIGSLRKLGSVIFVSHRLQEVLDFTDRVYVLRDGKVVAERVSADTHADELFGLMTGRQVDTNRPEPRSFDDSPVALELRHISLASTVNDASLTVRRGQVHCLVGAVASGAEELTRILFGLEKGATGEIVVEGKAMGRPTPRSAINAGVGYLPSERHLEGMVDHMSVAENMTLVHYQSSSGVINGSAREKLTELWIQQLDVRPPKPGADISELSGGNQQKVVLAKWLCSNDLRVLVLDHPLRGLDPGAIENVKDAIREASSRGVAVLMVADTLEEALEIADVISVMKDGSVTGRFDLSTDRPTVVDLLEKMV